MAAATFAISCFNPLIAVFVRDILKGDVRTFGLISTLTGVGMIAGTQAARRLVAKASKRHVVLFSLCVMASGILLLGAARYPAAAAVGAGIMGLGVGLMTVPAQTLIQSETPLSMAGRVSSGVMSLISLAQILGLLLSGTLSGAIGLRPSFYASAVMLAAMAAAGSAILGRARKQEIMPIAMPLPTQHLPKAA